MEWPAASSRLRDSHLVCFFFLCVLWPGNGSEGRVTNGIGTLDRECSVGSRLVPAELDMRVISEA